jgi:putative hydrolase of the HAD superfamily
MNSLRAIVFDMDGTLMEWKDRTQGFEQVALAQFASVHRTLVALGKRPPDVQVLSSTLYAMAGTGWREAMQEHRSYTIHHLLEQGLPEMGVECSRSEIVECVAAFESLPIPIGATEGARSTLTALRAMGLKLGLISNSWSTPGCRDRELDEAGLLELLEVRVYSSQMDVMKPHPAIFGRALASLGVAAHEAAMVGDNLEMDVGGAQGIGMRGVWLDNGGRGLPEDAKVQPDAVIQRLADIFGPLELWTGS